MNALNDQRVAQYLNETFISTYLKVGAFQIVGGQKVGGNVASYFCLADGTVIHAIPGQVDATKLLQEARWAYEIRKSALTTSTSLTTGKVDVQKYSDHIKSAHTERFHTENRGWGDKQTIPPNMPAAGQQGQAHWLLANQPLAKIDSVYPVVWQRILGEQLSLRPVDKR